MEHSKAAGIVKLLNIQELKLDSNQTSSCQKAPKSRAKVCLSIPYVGEMFIMCQTEFWVVQSAVEIKLHYSWDPSYIFCLFSFLL